MNLDVEMPSFVSTMWPHTNNWDCQHCLHGCLLEAKGTNLSVGKKHWDLGVCVCVFRVLVVEVGNERAHGPIVIPALSTTHVAMSLWTCKALTMIWWYVFACCYENGPQNCACFH